MWSSNSCQQPNDDLPSGFAVDSPSGPAADSSSKRHLRLGTLIASLMLLVACGGGSGEGVGSSPTTVNCASFTDSFGREVTCAQMNALVSFGTFNDGGDGGGGGAGADGSAGDGAPIANTLLRFTDINNHSVETTTDANGYFRFNLRGLKAPIVATVVRDSKPWKSMLIDEIVTAPANRKFYTINLTGLTDFIASEVALGAGLSGSAQLTPSVVQNNLKFVPIAKKTLNNLLVGKLIEAGLDPTTFDPISQPFKTDLTGYDKVLENVLITQTPGGATIVQPKFSIGGSFSGGGSHVGLTIANGVDSLRVTSNGETSFTMPTQMVPGNSYNLQITAHPTGKTCSVSNGIGTVGNANITNIAVLCSTTGYSLSGSVTGLDSANIGLTLSTNGQFTSVPAGSTGFDFPSELPVGTAYNIGIASQPTGATCSVSDGSGIMPAANVSSAAIHCNSVSARLGGSINGLIDSGLVLSAAGQIVSPVVGDNNFLFASPIAYGTPYTVRVASQLRGQDCVVTSNSFGIMRSDDITNVVVTCANVPLYTLGGKVSGNTGPFVLSAGGQTVNILGIVCATSSCSSSFTFPDSIASGTAYIVTVQTQPARQTCKVTNGSGTMPASNVSNLTIDCVTNISSTTNFVN